MPARNQQADGGKNQFLFQPDCQQMGRKMVHPDKGYPPAVGQSLGKPESHEQAPQKARPA